MKRNTRRALAGLLLPVVAAGLATIAASRPVRADAADDAARTERCAIRLSGALLGKSPSAALLASKDPQASVDAMLADPAFIERFSGFVNSKFNPEPGVTVAEDASYTLAKYILQNKKPWKDLFVGPYDVTATVADDPEGLGYFRSDAWMKRYAGNESAGYRLSSAYRMLQNTTGVALVAVTNVDGVDATAAGRQAPACAGCHYQNWYALDKVAKVLSRRQGTGTAIKFIPPNEGPQQILGGKTVANDKELLTALVESDNFKVNTCRLAFGFLYGRAENSCEAAVFDACISALDATGSVQASLASIAKDPSFCQ